MDEFVEKEMIALLPRLTRFARALTPSQDEADDLVQATCERAIANLDKWEPGTRLDSWMYRIAHNLRRNSFRNAATTDRKLQLVAAGPHCENLTILDAAASRIAPCMSPILGGVP